MNMLVPRTNIRAHDRGDKMSKSSVGASCACVTRSGLSQSERTTFPRPRASCLKAYSGLGLYVA